MEPLPEERSDDAAARCHLRYLGGASMEPLPEERSDADHGPQRLVQDAQASMEPLPEERSDEQTGVYVFPRFVPQWSRSRRSGAT